MAWTLGKIFWIHGDWLPTRHMMIRKPTDLGWEKNQLRFWTPQRSFWFWKQPGNFWRCWAGAAFKIIISSDSFGCLLYARYYTYIFLVNPHKSSYWRYYWFLFYRRWSEAQGKRSLPKVTQLVWARICLTHHSSVLLIIWARLLCVVGDALCIVGWLVTVTTLASTH